MASFRGLKIVLLGLVALLATSLHGCSQVLDDPDPEEDGSGSGSRSLDNCPTTEVKNIKQHKKPLASTMPDEILDGITQVIVTDANGNTVVLEVESYTRRYNMASACGSVVVFKTNYGRVILDDTELWLTQSVRKALEADGFDLASISTSAGRRLSTGATVMGMFSFFEEYNWTCESVDSPMSNLRPPYMIELESHVVCPNGCDSELFPGYKLPGYVDTSQSTWAPGRAFKYLKVKETMFATETKVLSVQENPNTPQITSMTLVDKESDTKKTQVDARGTITRCNTTTMDPGFSPLTSWDNYEISVYGDEEIEDRMFRTYRIVPLHLQATKKEKMRLVIEYWEDTVTGEPYKYYMPFNQYASVTYFRKLSSLPDDFESKLDTLFDPKKCQEAVGPEVRQLAAFAENDNVLHYYHTLMGAGAGVREQLGGSESDQQYWMQVQSMKFEMLNSSTHFRGDGQPLGYISTARESLKSRRLAKADGIARLKELAESDVGRQLKDLLELQQKLADKNLTEAEARLLGWDATGEWCPDTLPYKLEIGSAKSQFCFKGTTDLATTAAERVKYSFSGGGEIPVGSSMTMCKLEASGVLDMNLLPEFSLYEASLSISLSLELDLFFMECKATLSGTVAGGPDSTDSGGQTTAYIDFKLGVSFSCKLFGIEFGPSVSGNVKFRFGDLFGSYDWDDYLSITAGVTLGVNLFIFSISYTWTATLLDHAQLNAGIDQLDDASSTSGAWTSCACGDWVHCSTVEYCDNYEIMSMDDNGQETGTGEYCNSGDWEYVTYDWNEKVDCEDHYKRCFCQKKGGAVSSSV